MELRRSALRDKNVGDRISVGLGGEGVKVVVVVGVDGDNNRTKDNLEGQVTPGSVSSPAVRPREFDHAATKPPLVRFVVISDVVDSVLAIESLSDCLSGGLVFRLKPSFNF